MKKAETASAERQMPKMTEKRNYLIILPSLCISGFLNSSIRLISGKHHLDCRYIIYIYLAVLVEVCDFKLSIVAFINEVVLIACKMPLNIGNIIYVNNSVIVNIAD